MLYAIKEVDGQPTDMIVRRVNEHLLISQKELDIKDVSVMEGIAASPKDSQFFARITNIGKIPEYSRNVPAASIPASGSNFDLANYSTNPDDWANFLKATDNTLYDLLIRFRSSHYARWEVRIPASTKIGGIKSSTDDTRKFTEDDIVHLHSTDTYWAKFKFFADSKATITWAEAYIRLGFKYSYKTVNYVPREFEPIVISDVGSD